MLDECIFGSLGLITGTGPPTLRLSARLQDPLVGGSAVDLASTLRAGSTGLG